MSNWFDSTLGKSLLEQEQRYCQKLVPSGYYPRSLQVGQPAVNFLDGIASGERFFVGECAPHEDVESPDHQTDHHADEQAHHAVALASAMPFADKTHDLIVLPHTLDFCEDPHGVLREINHILVPQGCVVITGFNGLSIWGAIRLMMKGTDRAPWNGRFQIVRRVQDWLSLLGFELVGAAMMAYQPPLQNDQWRSKLAFIDTIGARWWPGLGAVYVIVGRKKEIAISSDRATKLEWRRLLPGMAQPAARVRLKLVRTNENK